MLTEWAEVVCSSCFEPVACANLIDAACSVQAVNYINEVEATGECEVRRCRVEGRKPRPAVAA
jgi:hypothetical protein